MGTLTNETTLTQLAIIREHLMEHGSIDKPTALRLCGCDRLGARIWDIRNDTDRPLNIRTERVTKKNALGHYTTFAVYHYEPGEEDGS